MFFKFCLKNNLLKKDKNILKKTFWEYKIFVTFFLSYKIRGKWQLRRNFFLRMFCESGPRTTESPESVAKRILFNTLRRAVSVL